MLTWDIIAVEAKHGDDSGKNLHQQVLDSAKEQKSALNEDAREDKAELDEGQVRYLIFYFLIFYFQSQGPVSDSADMRVLQNRRDLACEAGEASSGEWTGQYLRNEEGGIGEEPCPGKEPNPLCPHHEDQSLAGDGDLKSKIP